MTPNHKFWSVRDQLWRTQFYRKWNWKNARSWDAILKSWMSSSCALYFYFFHSAQDVAKYTSAMVKDVCFAHVCIANQWKNQHTGIQKYILCEYGVASKITFIVFLFNTFFLAIFVLIPSHCMEKCSMNILLNFSFLVPQNKASIWVWNDMKMSERNNILIHQ